MKFRGIDANGDWQLGQGIGSYAKDADALALDIATRLRSYKGGCFFAMTDGVDYTNLLEKGQQKNLQLALQNSIMQTPGVVKILAIDFKVDQARRSLSATVTVQTIYSRVFKTTINNIIGGPASA